ncbi:MAG TPA: DUF192 domain-containing protein, partial [Candidatus Nanoarchaeia archaeon]|nr:DUF192 domain-containing protein [Candidatus Nanoarchaeia archaeon]
LRVEIADQAVQWQRGLQGRAKLAEDLGMLFVFPDARVRKFWMRDTSIPLDLLFFNEQREVIAIQHNVPPCKEEPCPTFGPDTSAQYVLEVNSGWAKEHGIKLGDKIGQ